MCELCKKKFKEVAVNYSVQRCENYYKKISELENSLRQINALQIDCSNPNFKEELINEKNDIINEISQLYREKSEGAIIRSRCKMIFENENPNIFV